MSTEMAATLAMPSAATVPAPDEPAKRSPGVEAASALALSEAVAADCDAPDGAPTPDGSGGPTVADASPTAGVARARNGSSSVAGPVASGAASAAFDASESVAFASS